MAAPRAVLQPSLLPAAARKLRQKYFAEAVRDREIAAHVVKSTNWAADSPKQAEEAARAQEALKTANDLELEKA